MSNRPKIEVPDAEWWAAQSVVSAARAVFDAVDLNERRRREDRLSDAIRCFDDVCEHKRPLRFSREALAESRSEMKQQDRQPSEKGSK